VGAPYLVLIDVMNSSERLIDRENCCLNRRVRRERFLPKNNVVKIVIVVDIRLNRIIKKIALNETLTLPLGAK
jgi:hypothetical protein